MNQGTRLFPALVALAAFAAALIGLNPTFYMDDSPEIATAAATLGVAHPPGYPLYILLGRLASLLPLGPICLRVNLLAALAGSLVCLLLFHWMRDFFRLPAFWALPFALIWMAGLTAYPAALSAKNGVYLLAGAFLLAAAAALGRRQRPLAFFLFGLSLAHHWMTMLPAAAGLAWMLLAPYRGRELPVKEWFRWAAFSLLGLSLYLYLPLRSTLEPLVNWAHPVDLSNFWHHVTRYVDKDKDLAGNPLLWAQQALTYLRSAWWEFDGLLLLAALGSWVLGKKDRSQAGALLLMWLGILGALCVFSKFSSEKPYLMQNYSIASYVFIPLFASLGFEWIRGISAGTSKAWAAGTLLLAWGGAGALLFLRLSGLGQGFYTYTYDYLLNAWRSVPRDALFFCKGDVLDFPAWYLQKVEGLRPDLPVLGGGSLEMDWYRIGLAKDHPGLEVPFPDHEKGKEYISGKLMLWMVHENAGRRLFFTFPDLRPDGLGDYSLWPNGLTQEALAPGIPGSWDEGKALSLWDSMRLRHFRGPDRSVDRVSWDYFLKDYGMARLWMAGRSFLDAQGIPGASRKDKEKKRALYAKALPHLLWAEDWDPDNASWALATALDESYLGDLPAAMACLKRAAKLGENDPQTLYQAALLAYQLGETRYARQWLQWTLVLEPGNEKAKNALDSLGPSR